MPRLERIQAGIRRVLATRGKKKRSRLPIMPTVLEGLKKTGYENTDHHTDHPLELTNPFVLAHQSHALVMLEAIHSGLRPYI